ncbi:MAG: TIGR01777 family oxidoreductase [Leadbetterella sp.]
MKIILAGGNGYLGKALQKYFSTQEVYILTRNPQASNHIYWDAKNLGAWINHLENVDVLINLTGKSVDCRYTDSNKKEILESRIKSTALLSEAINLCTIPPKVWLNSSSATIYNHAETLPNTESNGVLGDDFSMNICKTWENEFFSSYNPSTRKVALRTSIVFGPEAPAMKKLKLSTAFFLGGYHGTGNQMVSWIHELDFCRACEFIIRNEEIQNVVNLASPYPVSNKTLMSTIRKAMKIPFGFNNPSWAIELGTAFLGTESELLLKSRFVLPEKLLNAGFEFIHPHIHFIF